MWGFRPLLERYADASDRVELAFADPNTRPDLVEAYGLQEAALRLGLVHVAYGDATVEVTDNHARDYSTSGVAFSRVRPKTLRLARAPS